MRRKMVRNTATSLLFIVMFFQSSNAMSWSEELRHVFLRACIEGADPYEYRKAKAYCNCSLDEISDNYSVKELDRIGADNILEEPLVKRIIGYCAEKTLQ